MFRRLLSLCLLLLCAATGALAEETYMPALTNPVDQAIQQLAILSQQDAVFDGVPYDSGRLTDRGCGPVSLSNAIIASFGVTDKETAVGIVMETMEILTPDGDWARRRINLTSQPRLFDAQLLASGEYPNLSASVGAYAGAIYPDIEEYTAEETLVRVDQAARPSVLTSRVYVNSSWDTVVRILLELHSRGLDDATLCVARGDAGTKRSYMPLRSGKSGHYLTLMFHVGSFIESGAVYVLDSLPRAIAGEEFGSTLLCHSQYPFVNDNPKNAFNTRYTASRISPSVIKLSYTPDVLLQMQALQATPAASEAARLDALVEARARQLYPLVLYGSCTMFISLPGEN